ncbi:MAG: hypothetical protein ACFCD0_27830 [Gemmataceae bacterium]
MKRIWLVLLCVGIVACDSQTAPTVNEDDVPTAEITTNEPRTDNEGTMVMLGGLKSVAPASWLKQQPSNRLRKFQFQIPKVKGDNANAEIVIFYFGKGGGGGVDANLGRWKGQFEAPKGKKISDVASVKKFKVGDSQVTMLDLYGTYLYKFPPFSPRAKIIRKENYRRFGVIFETEEGPYFITFTGPKKTVDSNAKAFDSWIKGFK